MNHTIKYVLISVLASVIAISADQLSHAQTCSCAGAPLLGSQSAGASGAGNILFGLTYEFNQITDLYSGSDQLANNTVERNTQSSLLEMNVGITDRLSVSGTMSFVRKENTSGLNRPGGGQTTSASGIGDGIIMLRYVVSHTYPRFI
jgi:hypothetical protein